MKKNLLWSLLALLGFSMAFMSCEDSVSSSVQGTEGGTGVLGQFTGVVYDTVLGTPIQGVTVVINDERQTTTNSYGTYRFTDVPVGTYPISFKKDGYQFVSGNSIMVDAKEYINDDPFLQAEALRSQLAALNEWAASNIPGYEPGTSTGSWTYNGGTWTYGDGIKTIQGVEIKNIGLNYTYSKAYNLGLQGLVPLSGSIKGAIKLLAVPETDAQKVPVTAAVAMPSGINFWLTTEQVIPSTKYGPFTTAANGAFSVTGVPVGVALKLETNGFTSGNYYYAADAELYFYNYDSNVFSKMSDPNADGSTADSKLVSQSGKIKLNADGSEALDTNGKIQFDTTPTDVGTLYLFTAGDFALVIPSGTDTGTPSAPKAVTGTATVKFSKAIKAAGFTATLKWTDNAAGVVPANNSIPLLATFDTTKTIATLKADVVPTGLNKKEFPYSKDSGLPVGYIVLEGYAEDGAKIYNIPTTLDDSEGLPLYTTEGIKLVDLQVSQASTSRPGRAVEIPTAYPNNSSVKLTFSKPVNSVKVMWTEQSTPPTGGVTPAGVGPDYRFYDSTNKIIEVFADVLSGQKYLWYSVASAADTSDTTYNTVAEPFSKQRYGLTLKATNLYAIANNERGGIVNPTTPQFVFLSNTNVALPIQFDFIQNIPDGFFSASITDITTGTVTIMKATRTAANQISILPQTGGKWLDYGTQYKLDLTITKSDGVVIFDKTDFVNYPGIVSPDTMNLAQVTGIVFTTQDGGLKLSSTNLYEKIGNVPSSTTKQFEFLNDTKTDFKAITFEFDKVIPAQAEIVASLETTNPQVTIGTRTVPRTDRKFLDIYPASLSGVQYETQYTLKLSIKTVDGTTLFSTAKFANYPLIVAANNGAVFTTTDTGWLSLDTTNLYRNNGNVTSSTAAQFPIINLNNNGQSTAPITFTFDKALPSGRVIEASLWYLDNNTQQLRNVPLDSSSSATAGKTVSFVPAGGGLLNVNTKYVVDLIIKTNNLTEIFNSARFGKHVTVVANDTVGSHTGAAFTTVTRLGPPVATGTNLYGAITTPSIYDVNVSDTTGKHVSRKDNLLITFNDDVTIPTTATVDVTLTSYGSSTYNSPGSVITLSGSAAPRTGGYQITIPNLEARGVQKDTVYLLTLQIRIPTASGSILLFETKDFESRSPTMDLVVRRDNNNNQINGVWFRTRDGANN
jgi:hypothetical protein